MSRIAIALSLCLLAVACRATTETIDPTPTASPSVTPTGTGSPEPRPPKEAALVVYATGDEIFLYDAATDQVRSVARGAALVRPRFLTRDTISFQRGEYPEESTIFRLDLTTGETEEIFREPEGVGAYAFSPDGREIAYVIRGDDGFPHLRIRTLVPGQPVQAVTTLARATDRGVTDEDQADIRYQPNSKRFLVSYSFADTPSDAQAERSQLQLRARGGSLEFAAEHENEPTHAIWAHNNKRIYFSTDRGVRALTRSSGQIARLGIDAWFHPTPSQDGRRIAYDTGPEEGDLRVRVYDLRSGTSEAIGKAGRAYPIFATAKHVWAQVFTSDCPGGCSPWAWEPTPEVVRINRVNGKEKPLALTSLIDADVWYERSAG